MKIIRSRSVFLFSVLVGCTLLACGGVELKPEQQALVDKYERLIDSYELNGRVEKMFMGG